MKSNKLAKTLALGLVAVTSLSIATGCNKGPDNPDKPEGYKVYTEEELLDLNTRDVVAENGVVAAANPFAANCGIKVLEAGGNAFDAAVAVSFGLGLCEPHCSGIGGGGILVGYDANAKEFVSYNFREFVPGAGTYNEYGAAEEMDEGIRAAGVPTIVQSLLGIMDKHGNFNNNAEGRRTVIGPASEYAHNGFTVTKELASAIASSPDAWQWTKSQLPENYCGDPATYDDQAYHIFSDEGLALDKGDTLVNENLGKVYDEIIEKGADGFYKGWVAQAMLEAQDDYIAYGTTDKHGLWTAEDFDYVLANYPKAVTPVTGTFSPSNSDTTYDIVSATCPSSGGLILLEALNMIEAYELNNGSITDLGHNSAEYINLMSTITQLAYGDKQKYIGDASNNPATGKPFVDVPVDGLLNKEYAAYRLMENYNPGKAFNGKHSQKTTTSTGGTVAGQNYGDPWKFCEKGSYHAEADVTPTAQYAVEEEYDPSADTTSFSCADKYGNIVTITQTINHFFGAKLMPKGCGFYLNNQLSSFTKTSGSASIVAPYKHPTSHIMPTIILDNGQPVATLGSPGSMRLVTAVYTTVINMLEWGMDIQSAIEAARVYSYCVSSSDNGEGEGEGSDSAKALYIEQVDEITPETKETLTEWGYACNVYTEKNLFFGGVQGITFENGKMHGGADIRRDGKALGF